MQIGTRERILWAPALTVYSHDGTTRLDPQPVATAWECSIDGGTTWVAARAHPDDETQPCWLVAGPGFPAAGDSAGAATTDLAPAVGGNTAVIRLRDTPETLETTLQIYVR